MYHELSERQRARRSVKRIFSVLLVIVLCAAVVVGFTSVNKNLREQGEASVRNAILNSAKQCCAIEGSYPSSVAYLEENYGLVINRNNYTVTYEIFASNVMPSVVVTAK